MDVITQLAYTLNNGWLATISSIIDNDIVYALLLLAAIAIGERRPKKIAKIVVILVVGIIIGSAAKNILAVERPCASLMLDYCPKDYSLPSLHALTAFIVMIAFLNKPSFFAYALFALFIAFTRLVLAVHSFRDISAALAIALITYHVVDAFWRKEKEMRINQSTEKKRQILHIIVAVGAIIVLLLYGRGVLMSATFFILVIGLILVNQAYLGKTNRIVEWFIRNFEREGVRFPGWGSACYATGVLLLTSITQNPNYIIAGLVIIGFGDALSTLAGSQGKIRLPYNKKKTLEGSVAFFLSSLPTVFLIGPAGIAAGAIATFVESLPLPLDDNITLASVLTILFLLM